MKKILLYGYGNPGRMDDGLGNEFINRINSWIEEKNIKNILTDSNYQLNIEDAETISHFDLVYFIDASQEDINDFIISEVNPDDAKIEFTMHAVSTSFIADLCKKLYGRCPETHLVHIKGYEWEFREELSTKAEKNLEKALVFMKNVLEKHI